MPKPRAKLTSGSSLWSMVSGLVVLSLESLPTTHSQLPTLWSLNHFFKLRAKHIHLASGVTRLARRYSVRSDKIATERDVKPIAFFAFGNEIS